MVLDTYEGDSFEEVIPHENRVILIGNNYNPCPEEPVWGSEYECVGTIHGFWKEESEYDVEVFWDNGHSNPYKIEDLSCPPVLDKTNPNYTFRLKKRTTNGQRKPKQNF